MSADTDLSSLGRFSEPTLLILSSLASGPKHGCAMTRDITQFSGTRLELATLYGALARLERRGWIVPLPVEDRRRRYCLTSTGALALRQQLAAMQRVATVGLDRLASS